MEIIKKKLPKGTLIDFHSCGSFHSACRRTFLICEHVENHSKTAIPCIGLEGDRRSSENPGGLCRHVQFTQTFHMVTDQYITATLVDPFELPSPTHLLPLSAAPAIESHVLRALLQVYLI